MGAINLLDVYIVAMKESVVAIPYLIQYFLPVRYGAAGGVCGAWTSWLTSLLPSDIWFCLNLGS